MLSSLAKINHTYSVYECIQQITFCYLLKINLNKNPIFAKNWAPKVGETH